MHVPFGTKKILAASAALMLLTVGACTSPEPEGPNNRLGTTQKAANGQKEWTLILYMVGDSNNESIAIDDINAMERGVNTTDYNLLVQLDRIPGNDSSNGNWTDCRRFLIEPDPNSDRVIRSTELMNLGEVNMGDPQTFADFIIWGMQNYPAKRYLVAIWGGAMPNGIGGDASESPVDPMRTIFGELTQAYDIASTAVGRRFDFCVQWGCNYGMFENDWVVKEYCDVVARSEIPTWNAEGSITDILNWLNANPTGTPRQFAEIWVDSCIDYATAQGRAGGWASLDLGPDYVRLGLAVDIFARELIKAGGITQVDIAQALDDTVHCYDMEMDLNHFAKNINTTAALPQPLRDAAQDVMDQYGWPPPQGIPLINFRFVEGFRATNEVWPTGDANELKGTKIRQLDYSQVPSGFPGEIRYGPFVDNNAWHWFLEGETSLPAEPLVTFESNSQGDTIPTGAPFPFTLTLRNSGGQTASNVSAVLTTQDLDVTVTQNTSGYPNIASEGNGDSQASYSVTVDPNLPDGHRIWFWLDVTANSGNYTNTTTFCVEVDGCANGATRSCYDGPAGTEGVGVCAAGTQTCAQSAWGACTGQTTPSAENCTDNLDNDCDGLTDTADATDCPAQQCADGDSDGYGDPPTGCANPQTDCDDSNPDINPGAVESCNGADDDCDGVTDETWPTLDTSCIAGVGACEASGTVVCTGDGSGVECDAVPGTPSAEVCGNQIDEDCDGALDNGCACTPGESRPCYGGPAGTEGVGICQPGTQNCPSGTWESCQGQVLPELETCADSLDNDCDGTADADDDDCGGDSDLDGLPDWWEEQHFGDLSQNASDDPDGDGLNNGNEYTIGTDPTRADTDGDGFSDGAEVAEGTDPLDPDSYPGAQPAAQSSKGCGCSHAPTPDASIPIWLALFGILFMAVLKRKRTRR